MTQRIILHVGLPKTGTSALQEWCAATFPPDSDHDIEYSSADIENELMPKHQFLVSELMTGKYDKTEALLAKPSNKKVFILSTEGLSNHLYDFSPSSLKKFRELFSSYHVDIFIVFRNTEPWIKSYYKQCVINPTITQFNYATPLHLNNFSKLERIQKLTTRHSVETDAANFFGARTLVSADYDGDWGGTFLNMLELNKKIKFTPYSVVNASIEDYLIELVRQINSFNLEHNIRELWLALIQHAFKTNSTTLQLYEKKTTKEKLVNQINFKYLDYIAQEGELNGEKIEMVKKKLFTAYHHILNKTT